MKASDQKTVDGILFTDQYELTMAQLYYRQGLHETPVQFDHFFRSYPDYGGHKAGYCVNAGLEWLLDWMRDAHFRDEDIAYLRSQRGSTGRSVFDEDFLRWLKNNGSFETISLHAIPEGRVVHPNAPVTVVRGSLAMAQILESSLLNHLNYQTLIATKAARIRETCKGQLFMEFGMRRAQGKGANAGARAALIGGADFTSNVGISHVLGFPPKGTHAHSMVQVFLARGMSELDAFRSYAEVYPDDCLLLVDTINTLESGIPHAITVFEELKKKGHKPKGIRLDSGDLAYLSIQAAKMLDEAGFPDTSITLSNELDELTLWQIITQIADEATRYGVDPEKLTKRLAYGVGTKLITSGGDSALGGIYKLVSVWGDGKWLPAIKISETLEKTPNPGNKQVWRIYDQRNNATADLLCLDDEKPQEMEELSLFHPSDMTRSRVLKRENLKGLEPLLVEVLSDGKLIYELPSIQQIRDRRDQDISRLEAGIRRLLNPHIYHVSLSRRLAELKWELIKRFDQNGGQNILRGRTERRKLQPGG